jgi:peroxiredoxin
VIVRIKDNKQTQYELFKERIIAMRHTRLLWALAVTVLLAGFSVTQAAAIDEKDFTLKDLDGQTVTLSDFKGKIIVLEWTNYDCPFVKAHYAPETMTTAKLAAKYADAGVVWLTINSTHYATPETVREWAEPLKLPQKILLDPDGKAGKLFGAKTTPHIFILDRAGELAYQGALDNAPLGKHEGEYKNYAAAALEELAAGKEVSVKETTSYGCSVKYAPEPAAAG